MAAWLVQELSRQADFITPTRITSRLASASPTVRRSSTFRRSWSFVAVLELPITAYQKSSSRTLVVIHHSLRALEFVAGQRILNSVRRSWMGKSSTRSVAVLRHSVFRPTLLLQSVSIRQQAL